MLNREVVRARNPLERVVPELLGHPLFRRGREWVTYCPWHNDRDPSLRINVQKQLWFCDACAEGGDVFTFVMKLGGVSFVEALHWLAQRAGIADHGGANGADHRRI